MAVIIDRIATRSDNWTYVIRGADGATACVVDPGEAMPVVRALENHGLDLSWVLLTHHHGDHTAGVEDLRRYTDCKVASADDLRLPTPDLTLHDGLNFELGGIPLRAVATPGHTRSHIAFYSASAGALWTGDCLFDGGCGRIMEGDAAQMWSSLTRLAAFPPETRVFAGHNYVVDNLLFALSVVPDDSGVRKRLQRVRIHPKSLDATLAEELATNPFLRCESLEYRLRAGLGELSALEAFAELRRRKDRWGS